MDSRPLLKANPILKSPFVPVLSRADGEAAEGIRVLRTRLMAQHLQVGHRALAVCAASENVGCTYIAVNLAIAMSQIGTSTLLIDGNLRHPRVERVIQRPSHKKGLHQYLTASAGRLGEYVNRDVLPNLSILFAGGQAPNAQELLAGDRFEQLIDTCLREYDATIVDTPPANGSSDVNRICNVVSYCLIVARRNVTLVSDVKMLADQLRADRAHIIGTVLNE
jgi:capsular exopolysaccharide synthesis family protein